MRVKKLLAMFLLVLLLCQPMLALQSLASAESSGYSEEPSIVRELTELRSTDSSTFLRDDGTYECVIYSEDKFYRNAGGEMTEIDNSIVNTNFTRNSLNYRFANAANDVRFFFADGETSSVSADYDGHFVSFIPINANNVIAVKDAQYRRLQFARQKHRCLSKSVQKCGFRVCNKQRLPEGVYHHEMCRCSADIQLLC